ncbi:unnamed protein product [Effrenium voratum]|nr:unnamed protein product [Effrenium voratum]
MYGQGPGYGPGYGGPGGCCPAGPGGPGGPGGAGSCGPGWGGGPGCGPGCGPGGCGPGGCGPGGCGPGGCGPGGPGWGGGGPSGPSGPGCGPGCGSGWGGPGGCGGPPGNMSQGMGGMGGMGGPMQGGPGGPPAFTQQQAWGAAPAAQGFGAPGPTIDTFVEVSPEVQPVFRREQAFSLQVPRIRVRLTTNCSPPPPMEPGLAPFKPYEEFWVDMPELSWVIFNPWSGTPPGGVINAQTRKRGAVLEVSPSVTLNAKLKANSPYGTLVVEDYQVGAMGQQKVGETPLNYQLKVEGSLAVNKGFGNNGANRLEVDLAFYFTASMSTGLA